MLWLPLLGSSLRVNLRSLWNSFVVILRLPGAGILNLNLTLRCFGYLSPPRFCVCHRIGGMEGLVFGQGSFREEFLGNRVQVQVQSLQEEPELQLVAEKSNINRQKRTS